MQIEMNTPTPLLLSCFGRTYPQQPNPHHFHDTIAYPYPRCVIWEFAVLPIPSSPTKPNILVSLHSRIMMSYVSPYSAADANSVRAGECGRTEAARMTT